MFIKKGVMMQIKVAYSQSDKIHDAVSEIKEQFIGLNSKVVLFFASSKFDPVETATAFAKIFPNTSTLGCSTAGEIISGMMLKNAVVAMALSDHIIEDHCFQIVEGISSNNNVDLAFKIFENHFNVSGIEMDFTKYVGVILTDGLSGAEERIMDRISDLTNVLFVGASAGDDLKFSKTWVYANGKAYTDAVLLILFKPLVRFDFIKTQSFTPLPEQLVPTQLGKSARQVVELNGMPAAQAYAQAIGVKKEELENRFMLNPVGLMINDEPFVRSPQRLNGDAIEFYCRVSEGMSLRLLESMDIVADTKAAIDKKLAEMGKISGIINFHCILRTLELEKKNRTDDYGRIFTNIPTIGFSTYGESFHGHINQTSTMLVFN
jgi:hypothetical protein